MSRAAEAVRRRRAQVALAGRALPARPVACLRRPTAPAGPPTHDRPPHPLPALRHRRSCSGSWARRSRPWSCPREASPACPRPTSRSVYRLLVHRWRSEARAKALRALYAPVSLVSLPLVWMLLMVVAFTFVFWGTGGLTWQKAFEISGSSLTTLGFSKPDGTGRIWLAFIEATIGLGLVALLISYLPTIFSAYNGRERGIIRLRPIAGAPPRATELLQSLHRIGFLDDTDYWQQRGRMAAGPGADPHRLPDPLLLPRDPARALLGRHRRLAARRRRAGRLGVGDQGRRGLRGRREGAPDDPRLRAATDRAHRPGSQRPPAAAEAAPRSHRALRRARTAHQRHPQRVPRRHGHPDARSSSSIRAARRRDGAGSPGSAPPTTRRCAALAGLTTAYPAPWTTDHPAEVGKPRFMSRRPLHVDWSQGLPAGTESPVA